MAIYYSNIDPGTRPLTVTTSHQGSLTPQALSQKTSRGLAICMLCFSRLIVPMRQETTIQRSSAALLLRSRATSKSPLLSAPITFRALAVGTHYL